MIFVNNLWFILHFVVMNTIGKLNFSFRFSISNKEYLNKYFNLKCEKQKYLLMYNVHIICTHCTYNIIYMYVRNSYIENKASFVFKLK